MIPDLEVLLGKIEGLTADIFKQLELDGLSGVDSNRYLIFLVYIVVQHRRTLAALQQSIDFHEGMKELVMRDAPEGSPLPKQLEGDPLSPTDLTRMAFEVYPHIYDLKIVLIKNETRLRFITSDDPVVLFNKAGEQGRLPNSIGLNNSGLLIYLPLGPKFAALLFDGGIYRIPSAKNRTLIVNREADVSRMNRLQILNAHQCVYSQKFSMGDLQQIKRVKPSRLNSRVDLNEYIEIEKKNGSITYRRRCEGEEIPKGTSSLISNKNVPIQSDFRTTFLKYNLRARFTDTGTGAGFVRAPKFLELVGEFYVGVRAHHWGVLDFVAFLEDRMP